MPELGGELSSISLYISLFSAREPYKVSKITQVVSGTVRTQTLMS